MRFHCAIRTFAFLVVIALSPGLFASSKPVASGEGRYVIVLAPGARMPDIAALGGRVEASTWQSLTIVIPVSAEPALRASSAIRSITPVVSGSSDRTPADAVPARSAALQNKRVNDVGMPTMVWASGQYAYDGVGNITAMGVLGVLPNSDGKTSTFSYDLASRLTNATIGRAAGDRIESYSYDGFGNILQRTLNSAPGSYNPVPDPSTNQMTEAGTHYDEAGNLDNWATMASFTYDAVNQVTSMTPNQPGTPTSFYIYDVNEERVAAQSGSATQWTIRDLANKPIRQFSSGLLTDTAWSGSAWTWTEDFVWNGNKLVAGDRPPATGGPRNFHVDHLGSIRVATDGTGLVVSSQDYAPFGEELATAGTDEGPLKFTGHERDGNFDYMHARYYDWRRGRFLSVDPKLASADLGRPQAWNRYTYVENNPIGKVDPDGRESPRQEYRDDKELMAAYRAHGAEPATEFDKWFGRLMLKSALIAFTLPTVELKVAAQIVLAGAAIGATKATTKKNPTVTSVAGGAMDGAATAVLVSGVISVAGKVTGQTPTNAGVSTLISGAATFFDHDDFAQLLEPLKDAPWTPSSAVPSQDSQPQKPAKAGSDCVEGGLMFFNSIPNLTPQSK